MKKGLGLLMPLFLMACSQQVTISKDTLKDKIAGGWAGKMIGVSYGLPTEFKALGKMYEDSIHWTPVRVKDALWEDDLYVQLTLMDVMDKHGMQAEQKKYQEALATAGFRLWHANVQTRKNYFDSIFPPQSGQPEFNLHADDIDFQIEADYIGFMCPGMPQTANKMADYMGHIMNYGDGVYGGAFVASLYSEAYLQNDIRSVIEKALLSLPAESGYRRIIEDVIAFHQENPNDWTKCWQMLENKWARANICNPGTKYNIDAKLNGAYIVIGLLYGEGDINRTLEISTRCGQDSDCNPSNALAVLGIIKGFSAFPQEYREAIEKIGDKPFVHTNYSFNKAVERTADYAEKLIVENGGKVTEDSYSIVLQEPVALPMEDAFPNLVYSKRAAIVDADKDSCWTLKGNWQDAENGYVKYSEQAGDEITFTFEGTGASIEGWWVKNGGKADVYVDGIFKRTIDCFYYYAKQEHRNINIFHILNLEEGKHTINIVVKGEKREESEGCAIGVRGAIVFKNGTKSYDAMWQALHSFLSAVNLNKCIPLYFAVQSTRNTTGHSKGGG